MADTTDALLRGLTEEVRALREVVTDERYGRRLTIRALTISVCIGFAAITSVGLAWRDAARDDARIVCQVQRERTAQIRTAVVAGVAAVTRVADVPAGERAEMIAATERDVARALPPPDC